MSLFILLAVFSGAAYIIRNVLLHRHARDDIHRIPSPPSGIASWIWGHELLVFTHQATEMHSIWSRTLGPLFKIKAALFHPDIIVAADHAAVQHIFADPDNYVKSPAFRPPVANIMGKGLVWAEGEDHKLQRRILTPAFSPESVRGMADDISECAEKLESRLTNYVLSHNGGATINIVEYSSATTLDIIGRVGFGHDFQASTGGADAKAISTSWAHHVNTGLSFSAFLAPLVVRAFPAITRAPLPLMQTQGAIKTTVRRLAGRLVEGAGKEGRVGHGRDILSILMRAKKDVKEGENGLTDDQILDNISTFTLVGHETTAGTLDFTLLALAEHPAVQAKLREEVLTCGRDLGYDDVQRLSYLDAVVKEGLRLFPASPQTERVALKDDVLPLSTPLRNPAGGAPLHTLRVRKGQVFHIPFKTMHTNPAVWGPDACVFDPARWLDPGRLPAPKDLPRGWGGLVAFCDGPRNCIGYRLAVFEFKVLLATLVRSLEFHATEAVVQQKISPTLQPVTDGRGGLLPLFVTLAPAA